MTNLKRGIMNLRKMKNMSILKTILVSMFVIFSLISTGCGSSHDRYYREDIYHHEHDEDDPNYAAGHDEEAEDNSEDSSDDGGESDIVILGAVIGGLILIQKKFVWRMA